MQLFYSTNIVNNTCFLNEEESLHCIKVLRHKQNDELNIIDGNGGFYTGILKVCNVKQCEIEITNTQKNFQSLSYYLHIAIAPTKNNERLEWFLEKATEIGISEITLLDCEHSERKNINLDRIQKILVSAMKQSIKSYLPKCNGLVKFNDFVQQKNTNSNYYIAHCNTQLERVLLKQCFNKQNNANTFLIGPEGDFSEKEILLATQNNITAINFGNIRLRTETAALYVTTANQIMYND